MMIQLAEIHNGFHNKNHLDNIDIADIGNMDNNMGNTEAAGEHTEVVEEHMKAAGEYTEAAGEHTEVVEEYMKVVGEHTEVAGEHTEVVEEHTEVVEEHTEVAGVHMKVVGEHTEYTEVADNRQFAVLLLHW